MLTLLATTILCDTPCMDGWVLDPKNSILLVFVGSSDEMSIGRHARNSTTGVPLFIVIWDAFWDVGLGDTRVIMGKGEFHSGT